MNKTETRYLLLFLIYSIVLVSIYTIVPYTRISISNTFLWWSVNYAILIAFFVYKLAYYKSDDGTYLNFVTYYLIWNIICIIRGGFEAEIYWDWKELASNAICLLLPIISFAYTNISLVKLSFNTYLKIALPFFGIVFFLITTDIYGFYLGPIGILMLFFPALPKKAKIGALLITAFVLVIDLGARSNVIKFAIPLMLVTTYYFKEKLTPGLIEYVRKALFIIPILFFVLAVTEVFNIFNIKQYSTIEFTQARVGNDGETGEDDISADTRTGLYEEVLYSAKKNDYWWLGRTPARGNDSNVFYDAIYITGRAERMSNEVGILNVFTWTGIIGVVLYMFVFYSASYVALHNSNNFFCKIISVYIAFRWLFCWVEDINDFTLNMFMLWLLIGLVNSKVFRSMTDTEVIEWVKEIFIFNKKNYFK